jgi:hypothetical protein
VIYKLITQWDIICVVIALVSGGSYCYKCQVSFMMNVFLLVYPLKFLEKSLCNYLLIIVEGWSGPIGPLNFLLITLRRFFHMQFLLLCCISVGRNSTHCLSKDEE